MPKLRFRFDETKALESLVYIARQWPGITAFYAAKVLFFAEKFHINRFARPIVGDTFIAMPNGPVPSTIYDFIKGRLEQAGDPEAIVDALEIERRVFPTITARRAENSDVLSPSDLECLDEALTFCRGKSFRLLSTLTHDEPAWQEATANGPMDYEALIEDANPDRGRIVEEIREFAAYGVL